MPLIYDIKTDIRFQQGIEQGEEKKARQMVINLLNDGSMPVEKIAAITGVPLEFVLNIQQELENEKKMPLHTKAEQNR